MKELINCLGPIVIIIAIGLVLWLNERRERREYLRTCAHWQEFDAQWRPWMKKDWEEYIKACGRAENRTQDINKR